MRVDVAAQRTDRGGDRGRGRGRGGDYQNQGASAANAVQGCKYLSTCSGLLRMDFYSVHYVPRVGFKKRCYVYVFILCLVSGGMPVGHKPV